MSTFIFSLAVCFTLYPSVLSSPDTQSNETLPWTIASTGWAPEPSGGRGTMDIIWTCLVTILVCCWTINYPGFSAMDGKMKFPKILSTLVVFLAPELTAAFSAIDCVGARCFTKEIRTLGKQPWTMRQSFFVTMKGVNVKFKDCTHVMEMDPPGFTKRDRFTKRDQRFSNFVRAIELDLLDLSPLSEENIRAKCKSNTGAKFLACFQSTWLVAQVTGRAASNLPITALEVMALAYVTCTLITLLCWWDKPQNPESRVEILCEGLTWEEFQCKVSSNGGESLPTKAKTAEATEECASSADSTLSGFTVVDKLESQPIADIEPSDIFCVELWLALASIWILMVFGGVHCAAWNIPFPTLAEGVMWKVASILVMVLPLAMVFLAGSSGFWVWVLYLELFIHCLGRVYLLVEGFLAFRAAPIGVYEVVQWASYIPHV